MTQYSTWNVKLSNSKLNRLISGIRNGTEVLSNLLLNIIGDSNDETNFPHKLLLTETQVSRFRRAFANNSSVNIKLSKTQLPRMVQLGGLIPHVNLNDGFIVREVCCKSQSSKDSKKLL